MNNKSLTEAVALDCEMVGAGPGGKISMVARVSVVNEYYYCLYDKYVQPTKPVTNYRTNVSGIQPHHLISQNAVPLRIVQKEVAALLKGGILVGHSVEKDLKALGLCHPEDNVRDTAYYHAFQTERGTPSLKNLALRYTNMKIQNGAHCSVRDARAAMMVYKQFEDEWEEWLNESDTEEETGNVGVYYDDDDDDDDSDEADYYYY